MPFRYTLPGELLTRLHMRLFLWRFQRLLHLRLHIRSKNLCGSWIFYRLRHDSLLCQILDRYDCALFFDGLDHSCQICVSDLHRYRSGHFLHCRLLHCKIPGQFREDLQIFQLAAAHHQKLERLHPRIL